VNQASHDSLGVFRDRSLYSTTREPRVGIIDRFLRRAASSHPDDLLAALIDTVERSEPRQLVRLIDENRERIRAEFQSWVTVPDEVRADPTALGRYANTLIALATLFEQSGDPSLRRSLERPGGDNDLAKWTHTIERVDRLINEDQAAAAASILRTTLDEMRGVSGTGVAYLYPRVLGRLGLALSLVGEKDEAVSVTRQALDLCNQAGDAEGIETCTWNLQAIGAPEFALPLNDRPFHVVFFDADGRILSPDSLWAASGPIRWEVRGGAIHPEARRLHLEGRAAGERGDRNGAIAIFTEAASVDPAWPYPVYDRAFAHLLQQDFEAARGDYRKVLELSPDGFFLAATAADLLTREAAGEFPRGLCHAFVMLEHMTAGQQESIAEQLVERFPSHAPAWELHSSFIDDAAATLTAINRGLAARPDPDTRGSLLLRRALTLHGLGQVGTALELLGVLSETPDSLATRANAVVAAAWIRSIQP
jgi:tetratricopeptide (TPR) repeat protein